MIKLENITKIYRCGALEVEALRGISFEVKDGEFVSIVGPSGSGKSTLLHILGCLDRPTSGNYFLEDMTVEKLSDDELAQIRGRKIGFVFQFFNLFTHVSVLRNLELPMIFSGIGSPKYRMRVAMKMLYEVGLPEKARFSPMELSGGQQQKIAVARALINRPSILLADEPTGNLDSKSSEKVISLLRELSERGATIILVTHDEKIASVAKRKLSLYDGLIVKDEILY
ncbi:MAG: ABC transporter ATP-binding protein [Candidatus Margulisiibacteriota bacterium]